MTRWHVVHGEILDVPADGLICSANPSLNLSGGVGGAFLVRYGEAMQTFLHDWLKTRSFRYLAPGDAVVAPPCGSSFRAVAHAVAIDAFYDTDAAKIVRAYEAAIEGLLAEGCRKIAAACLGCGYGRCSTEEFLQAVRTLVQSSRAAAVDEFVFVTTNADLAEALTELIDAPSA